MFTVCPKCTLTLAVTAADLRAGQGYVRCGRCTNVFNALLTLSEAPAEALSPALTASAPALQPSRPAQGGMPRPAFTREIPGPFGTAASPEPQAPLPQTSQTTSADAPADEPAGEPADAAANAAGAAIESQSSTEIGTGTFETIVLEGDAILQTEEFVPEADVDLEIAALSERLDFASRQPLAQQADWRPMDTDTQAANQPGHGGHGSEAAALDDTDIRYADHAGEWLDAEAAGADDDTAGIVPEHAAVREDADGFDATRNVHIIRGISERDSGDEFFGLAQPAAQAPRRWPWLIGGVLLALLLGAQALNHWRDALAAQPRWNWPLTRLYGALGITLTPQWDLNAYDVRQQGAESDPAHAGAIRVRLSIANRAQRAQPLPVLRLTLLDRYGKRIAARDLPPAEYLPASAAKQTFLGPDQRIDTAVSVQDPNADSASFELDWCLRSGGPALRCAGDTPAVAAN